MTQEMRKILSDNPFILMADFEQAVRDGYRVMDTVQAYPTLNGIMKEVRLYRGEGVNEAIPAIAEKDKVVVADYNAYVFLKRCEAIILAGYNVDQAAKLNEITFSGPYVCTFVRSEEADVIIAEQTLKEIDQAKEANQDVVEEKPTAQKRGRKPNK